MPFEEYAAQPFVEKHDLLKYIVDICLTKKDGNILDSLRFLQQIFLLIKGTIYTWIGTALNVSEILFIFPLYNFVSLFHLCIENEIEILHFLNSEALFYKLGMWEMWIVC